jgi:hypothetical protein
VYAYLVGPWEALQYLRGCGPCSLYGAQDYLSGVTREEVEMAVHCDVVVFEWLLAYVEGKPAACLDVSNCVPILISSQFLKVRYQEWETVRRGFG